MKQSTAVLSNKDILNMLMHDKACKVFFFFFFLELMSQPRLIRTPDNIAFHSVLMCESCCTRMSYY